jgi:TetR/AcrR family transcriptional regulator, fatty acid metabolism regulator protein
MRRKEGDKANEILNAAIRVFAQEGFDKTQVSAIAASAGVGTGSIYLYFEGKEHILQCLFGRFWENLAKEMQTLQQDDPLLRINDQLGLFFDRLVESPELARVYLREHQRFLDSQATEALARYRQCLDLGESAFREILAASGRRRSKSSTEAMRLSQAFLFGGVRSALESWLSGAMSPNLVREHTLNMAMASILAASERIGS